jgi:hypothetical protein
MRSLGNYLDIPGAVMDRRAFWDLTKFSNIVRLMLLEQHGGTWMDATIFLGAPLPERVLETPFFVFRRAERATMMANFFFHARAANPIVSAMRVAYERYWMTARVPGNYFMFHYIFEAMILSSALLSPLWEAMPIERSHPTFALARALDRRWRPERDKRMFLRSPVQKLTYKRAPAGDGTVWDEVCSGRMLQELQTGGGR